MLKHEMVFVKGNIRPEFQSRNVMAKIFWTADFQMSLSDRKRNKALSRSRG